MILIIIGGVFVIIGYMAFRHFRQKTTFSVSSIPWEYAPIVLLTLGGLITIVGAFLSLWDENTLSRLGEFFLK
jgi:multisubunit Na+/H+ antiporter MnhB subunit